MKILITGITGFVGSHLAEYLLNKNNIQVYGIIRWRSDTKNISHLRDKLILHEADMRDATSMRSAIESIMPDKIFHLAAQSFVGTSFHTPQETLTTNIIGQLNIFEAVRLLKINPFIQIAGSSESYGLVYENELPVRETNPFRPLSPYGVSKVAQDLLGYQYFKSYGLNIVRTRAFNHTGLRRGEPFVCSNFAKQIALIEKKKQKPMLYVGNLEAIRDFSDARDIVQAYWLALEKCKPGEAYNISQGKGHKIREVLDILLSFTDVKIQVQEDPKRLRPSDLPILVGDSTKFRAETGWQPQIPFETTLEDLLNWWRANV
ncbi:MAG: GDP-mannose 4,6-dehydratase [Candidatus Omnitrophota bacterium]|nr:MAG: GDP-mannose 4,6-dehydratase [Candidatus Omnitrophota bacterium]